MAVPKPSHILVFGATGNIGKYITENLTIAQPPFERLTVFTSPATATSKADLLAFMGEKGVHIVQGDLNDERAIAMAYKGVDTVICCLGRGALQHQETLIRLAEESGTVQWFFPSEYGTDVEYGPKSKDEKTHQVKLQVRRYIKENVKRMKYTYLVTGPYIDMWLGSTVMEDVGGFDVAKKKAVLIGDGEGKIGFCTMSDVGKCLVAALHHPDACLDKAVRVQSFVVTPNQVLAEYEKQTGSKWEVSYVPLDHLVQQEKKMWDEAKPTATVYTLRRIWAEGGTLYDKNDNESIGLKQEDMDPLETAVAKSIGIHI